MNTDQIDEIGIDDKGSLYVVPRMRNFAGVYREAMEVHWDQSRRCLYSPKPREWSYLDWYRQILKAIGDVRFEITPETKWSNIDGELRRQIEALTLPGSAG